MYVIVESLYFTPETNVTLYVTYTGIKITKKTYKYYMYFIFIMYLRILH